MQVAPGVFQFRVPMPANPNVPDGRQRYTLVHTVETPEGWVLIDAGLDTDQGFEALQQQLSEAGLAPRDVTLIVITHGHTDHVGLANRVKELTGARLALHRLDATNPFVLTFQPGVQPPAVDLYLEGGEELVPGSGLWTVWAPGHTPGHLCIHDRQRRLLFSGDHLLPRTTPNVSLTPGDEGNPLKRFLESQQALKQLQVEAVHPAHEHSFSNLAQRVDEIIAHHEERAQEVLALVRAGPKPAWEIATGIRWKAAPWDQLNAAARQMALMETMAHLQYLVEEGRLKRRQQGGTLLDAFRQALEPRPVCPMALVGSGRLGRATVNSPELDAAGFKILAAFDADPRQVGQPIGGLVVEPMGRLRGVLSASDIRTAIVAVPPQHAQGVIDHLVACGVQTIVNYAPITPAVPPQVGVHNVNAVLALQASTVYEPSS